MNIVKTSGFIVATVSQLKFPKYTIQSYGPSKNLVVFYQGPQFTFGVLLLDTYTKRITVLDCYEYSTMECSNNRNALSLTKAW